MVAFNPCFVVMTVMAHELAVVQFSINGVDGDVNGQFECLAQVDGFESAVYVIPCEHDVVPFFAGHFAQYAFAGVNLALFDVFADEVANGLSVFAFVAAFFFVAGALGFHSVVAGD